MFAAPELSLTPRQWCFPVAGCVSYRGYFDEADARAEAARLHAAGDDVWVSGVPAYSTLGYFDDPVLSTFVRWPEVEVARMVFHELAHQVVYVKDDTQFNESFAAAVEEAGVQRWLAAQRNPALDAQYARNERLRHVFRDLIGDARARLSAVYASDAPEDAKRAEKAAAFAAMKAAYEQAKAGEAGPGRLRPLVRRPRRPGSQQRERRVRRAVHGAGAGVPRAARGGGRRPRAVLRAGAGAGRAAEGRARRACSRRRRATRPRLAAGR